MILGTRDTVLCRGCGSKYNKEFLPDSTNFEVIQEIAIFIDGFAITENIFENLSANASDTKLNEI